MEEVAVEGAKLLATEAMYGGQNIKEGLESFVQVSETVAREIYPSNHVCLTRSPPRRNGRPSGSTPSHCPSPSSDRVAEERRIGQSLFLRTLSVVRCVSLCFTSVYLFFCCYASVSSLFMPNPARGQSRAN